jgi:putative membrane protein
MKKRGGAKRSRSILKGAMAGLVGGLAGAAAKAYAEKIYARKLAEAPGALARVSSDDVAATAAPASVPASLVPWVFGGLAGAAYGVAVEMEASAGGWQGAAFGLAINRVAAAVPLAGLNMEVAPPGQSAIRSRVMHGIYGVVTEVTRRFVRRGLG